MRRNVKSQNTAFYIFEADLAQTGTARLGFIVPIQMLLVSPPPQVSASAPVAGSHDMEQWVMGRLKRSG